MKKYLGIVVAAGVGLFAQSALGATVSLDLTKNNTSASDVKRVDSLTFDGNPFGAITATGYHLFFNADGSRVADRLHSLDGKDVIGGVVNVGVTADGNGVGVRDHQLGNNEGRRQQNIGFKQEVLALEFGSDFDWSPISTTVIKGKGEQVLAYGANSLDAGISLTDDSLYTALGLFNIDATPDTLDFGANGEIFNYLILASVPTLPDGSDLDGFAIEIHNVVGQIQAVPVPAALPLMASGLVGIMLLARRKKKSA